YIGAIVIFLAILGLFAERRKIKYIFATGAVISILLSWGKHFPLTDLLIDYFPLYNKFRAVASIQVIAELCIPVLSILGLQSFFMLDKINQWNVLKKSTITFGTLLALLLIGYFTATFESENDLYYGQNFGSAAYQFVDALVADRKAMYLRDVFRTLIFTALSAMALYLVFKDKISSKYAIIAIGLLGIIDLVAIDTNYVNKDNFVSKSQVNRPFQPTEADEIVLKKDGFFRVFDQQGAFNSARASYFHQALGGYHAAKPKKIQELMDYQLANQNLEILNMYNVKYVFTPDESVQGIPLENPSANDNAWFEESIQVVNKADEAMAALSEFDSKKTAIIQNRFAQKLSKQYTVDSLASIQLIQNKSNHLIYES